MALRRKLAHPASADSLHLARSRGTIIGTLR